MIIIKISDGLGNQLFQYALIRSLSIKRNSDFYLDTTYIKNNTLRTYKLDQFNVVDSDFSLFEKTFYIYFYRLIRKMIIKLNLKNKIFKSIYWEKNDLKFHHEVFENKSNYYFGYWQNLNYFKEIREILLKELTLNSDLNDKSLEILKEIKNTNSISIHIRRGDYTKIKHQQVCDLTYYYKAIKIILEKIENPIFFIFSDDIDWAKKNLKIDFKSYYIDFNGDNSEFDLELIKNCKHNIIANSTFSWWGAWLNKNENKIIILPKYWRKGLPTPEGLKEKSWITI